MTCPHQSHSVQAQYKNRYIGNFMYMNSSYISIFKKYICVTTLSKQAESLFCRKTWPVWFRSHQIAECYTWSMYPVFWGGEGCLAGQNKFTMSLSPSLPLINHMNTHTYIQAFVQNNLEINSNLKKKCARHATPVHNHSRITPQNHKKSSWFLCRINFM